MEQSLETKNDLKSTTFVWGKNLRILKSMFKWSKLEINNLKNRVKSLQEVNDIISELVKEHRQNEHYLSIKQSFSLAPKILQMPIGG